MFMYPVRIAIGIVNSTFKLKLYTYTHTEYRIAIPIGIAIDDILIFISHCHWTFGCAIWT